MNIIPSALNKVYNLNRYTYEEVQLILNSHTPFEIKRNAYFIKRGQISNEYYCIESGIMRSFVNDLKGNEVTTNFFTRNQIAIDVASLFKQERAKESIQAITDCKVYIISLDSFQNLFHTVPKFREWGRLWMTESLIEYKARSIDLISTPALERYTALANQFPEIIQNAPLKQIASYLGITNSTLSRIRSEITS
ncbi:MAG: Crp/Fnr family transcriptional regulator [Chitinophagales bacterium]|nr:Crp/Fnr family transcriptional regulator [Chitinophagales bacterium]